MRIGVLFFATAREAAATDATELDLPEGSTVGHARDALGERFPELQIRLPHCRFAVNREFAGLERPLTDGAELAVIPPVSGG